MTIGKQVEDCIFEINIVFSDRTTSQEVGFPAAPPTPAVAVLVQFERAHAPSAFSAAALLISVKFFLELN